MLTKRISALGLAAYSIALPIVTFFLLAFSPGKQEEISLRLPIDNKHNFLLESGYGERLHPVLGVKRLHTGIDLTAEEGVPVVSTQEGVVIMAELADAWGNKIVIQHNGTYSTSYSHLKSMKVKVGDKVDMGQEIGLVGNTGMSTKYHLHFELLKNSVAIDPISYLPQIK